MIATTTHTIRENIIRLLEKSGHTPLQAVNKWDNVYSKQYRDAKPGIAHVWIIGEYEFIFTKQGDERWKP